MKGVKCNFKMRVIPGYLVHWKGRVRALTFLVHGHVIYAEARVGV